MKLTTIMTKIYFIELKSWAVREAGNLLVNDFGTGSEFRKWGNSLAGSGEWKELCWKWVGSTIWIICIKTLSASASCEDFFSGLTWEEIYENGFNRPANNCPIAASAWSAFIQTLPNPQNNSHCVEGQLQRDPKRFWPQTWHHDRSWKLASFLITIWHLSVV